MSHHQALAVFLFRATTGSSFLGDANGGCGVPSPDVVSPPFLGTACSGKSTLTSTKYTRTWQLFLDAVLPL